jgi:hypothetical protein
MATKFRTSFTHVAGAEAAQVLQARIININLVKWTVDVVTKFDRKVYLNIQVSGLYLHHSNGEGVYAFPEVGATCMVCLPSDTAPPFIMCFVMATELVDDSSSDATQGTVSRSAPAANITDASFAGGRPNAKPGDIWLRTRDGNFLVLHRGGVLQIGATELAQRIYIPLNNLVMDMSENYEHNNAAGSINWGIQDGPSLTQYPGQYMHTFRVFATDQYADVKLAVGKVFNPIAEPDGGVTMAEAEIAKDDDGKGSNPIIVELTVSPKGFVAESGDTASPSAIQNSVFKFVFDRTGNTLLRTEGNLLLQIKKKLTFKVTQDISIQTEAGASLKSATGFDIDGGSYTHVKGDVVRLGQGEAPVARVGDIVNMALAAAPLIITFSAMPAPGAPVPCTVATPAPLVGSISSGNNQVLA